MNVKIWPDIVVKGDDRFLWYVAIKKGDTIYREPVFSRKVEHNHGKMNNTSPDYWLLTDVQINIDADDEDEQEQGGRFKWIPYGDKFCHDVNSWSYILKSYNVLDHYSKYDSDEWSVKAKVSCEMYCNGVHVWNLNWNGSDLDLMMAKVKVLSDELVQHEGFEANEINKIIGKKVWFKDQEGIVVNHFFPDDRIVIKSCRPDGKGFNLKRKRDTESDWPSSEWDGELEVHTGLFDSDIYWFRN